MERKPKVKLCKCGAGIPLYSPFSLCYTCMHTEPGKGKVIEILQKSIKNPKILETIIVPKRVRKSKDLSVKSKPKVISKKKLRKKALSH